MISLLCLPGYRAKSSAGPPPCLTKKTTFGPKIERRQRDIEKMDLSWLSMGLLLGSIWTRSEARRKKTDRWTWTLASLAIQHLGETFQTHSVCLLTLKIWKNYVLLNLLLFVFVWLENMGTDITCTTHKMENTYLLFVTDTTDGVCVKKNCPV